MKTLCEVGFDGLVIPDHFPGLAGDDRQRAALAYAIAYIRALHERAKAESERSGP